MKLLAVTLPGRATKYPAVEGVPPTIGGSQNTS